MKKLIEQKAVEANNSTLIGAKASKTQILSDVMKNAWRFFRMTGASFSECLQRAWRNFNLTKRMLKGIVHFYFQKVDGSIREAWGTLYNSVLPETNHNRKKNDFGKDLYNMLFYRCNFVVASEYNDVYYDMLVRLFEKETGLYTRL